VERPSPNYPCVEQADDVFHRPHARRQAGCHRGRPVQRLLRTREVVVDAVMNAETFVEICRAYVAAWQANDLESAQIGIAMRGAAFLGACAKVGLIALIDEATGYQYDRPVDALQFKLKLFLVAEMRKWEKTFPDEVWEQFGRLTNWTGGIQSRPKYWGKLVMKLILSGAERAGTPPST
jgi:hypothetical protein